MGYIWKKQNEFQNPQQDRHISKINKNKIKKKEKRKENYFPSVGVRTTSICFAT